MPRSESPCRAVLRRTLALAAVFLGASLQAQSNYATPYFFTTLAGVGGMGSSDGTGPAARFFQPQNVAVDTNGNVYVADTGNNTVRKITFYGVVTTLAGQAGSPGFVNGTGSAARFNAPRGVAVDSAGNVYVADTSNSAIRVITPAGAVTTFAGGTAGSLDGTGSAARFLSPNAIAIDASGTLYVADTGNHAIRKITPAGVVTTLAGLFTTFGSVDGTGGAARFNGPRGVAVDTGGNVYVADRDNNSIRKITPAGVVTTLAGNLSFNGGSTDGTGSAARFSQPYGVAVDAGGNVYVAEQSNKTIRRITPAGVVTTLAGLTNNLGSADGTGNAARFNDPQGVAVDSRGNVYVGDTNNHSIRMSVFAPSFTTHPVSQVVAAGASAALTAAAVSNVPLTYQWRKDGVAIAGATTTSLALTNIQAANLGSYTLVASGSVGPGPSTSNAAVISFTPPPAFATHPVSQNVLPGANATFTALATSTIPIAYQWQKDGAPIPGATMAALAVSNVQVSHLGNYTLVATNASGATTSNAAALGFIVSTAGRLINLSILTAIPTAGDAFTMGYVIGGAGTIGIKPVVIRAAGPSLGALNVPGTLNDPKIELFAGSTKTGENDNWGGSAATTAAMAAVGAFAYTGPTSLDAAVAASFPGGDNSVRVSAAGNGTGAVIAEVYDATPAAIFTAATPRLINVSVLKHLGTGLTAGFVLGGSTSTTVLIRAVGPTIGGAPFNVPGVVADPRFTLFGAGSTQRGENDNWGGTAELTATFSAVGAFALPANSRDAALLATLAPGDYTVQVSGVGGTTGTAIVEVYEVP